MSDKQKPSERILQIYNELVYKHEVTECTKGMIRATAMYLDEQSERNSAIVEVCKHEWGVIWCVNCGMKKPNTNEQSDEVGEAIKRIEPLIESGYWDSSDIEDIEALKFLIKHSKTERCELDEKELLVDWYKANKDSVDDWEEFGKLFISNICAKYTAPNVKSLSVNELESILIEYKGYCQADIATEIHQRIYGTLENKR